MARPNGSTICPGIPVQPAMLGDALVKAYTRLVPFSLRGNLMSNGRGTKSLAARIHTEEAKLPAPWPTEIRLSKDRRTLTVSFDNGAKHALAAEYLRVFSPSAEVQGHSPDQRQVVGGKAEVEILKIEPIGNYAVRLHFDDLHSSGIYSWDYFLKLGNEREALWAGYLEELRERGLTRERAAPRRPH